MGNHSAMLGPKLLLVEDDTSLAELLEYRFANEGYLVRRTVNGDDALAMAKVDLPDLVILDWMIEGTEGIEVCRQLRRGERTAGVPIIMLTARDDFEDRMRGLECGADHYVTKPFSTRDLFARASSVLRRARPALTGEALQVGDLTLDPVAYRADRKGKILELGPIEFRLLAFLMEHPERVFTRKQLLAAVWGDEGEVHERSVDVQIARLRKALRRGRSPDPIKTVRQVGYALQAR
jgi:two-component system, OmpR family, phosphate regulon response regulator PhoB